MIFPFFFEVFKKQKNRPIKSLCKRQARDKMELNKRENKECGTEKEKVV
jgi:hypothetical protein